VGGERIDVGFMVMGDAVISIGLLRCFHRDFVD
jgi:hypothetical protein